MHMHRNHYPSLNYKETKEHNDLFGQVVHALGEEYRSMPVPKEMNERYTPEGSVSHYFRHEYKRDPHLPSRNMDDVAPLLGHIVDVRGMEGLYAFFRAISTTSPGNPEMDNDTQEFVRILKQVVMPHFESRDNKTLLHGISMVGHGIGMLTGNLAHAIPAAFSARELKRIAQEREREPSLVEVETIMPLLNEMHRTAAHAIEVMNRMHPKETPLPELPPINVDHLRTSLQQTRRALELQRYSKDGSNQR